MTGGIHAHLGPACDKCWRDGHRDGWAEGRDFEAHQRGCRLLLLAGIVGVLAFVIGFVVHGSVAMAAPRSGLQSGDSFSAGRSEAPQPSLLRDAGVSQVAGNTGRPETGTRDASGGASSVPAAPTQLDDEGGISSALSQGWATFCRPTATRCQSWGGGALLGAVPSFRYGDKPYTVVVWHGSHHVAVRVVSYCACGDRAGSPTVIDLSPAAFMRLAPLSEGVIEVTLEAGGPSVTVPPTDGGG